MHAIVRWPEVRSFSKSQEEQYLVEMSNTKEHPSGDRPPPSRRLGFRHSVAAAARDGDPEDSLVGADVLGQEFGNDRFRVALRLWMIGDVSVGSE
jgi:hypothetical protein